MFFGFPTYLYGTILFDCSALVLFVGMIVYKAAFFKKDRLDDRIFFVMLVIGAVMTSIDLFRRVFRPTLAVVIERGLFFTRVTCGFVFMALMVVCIYLRKQYLQGKPVKKYGTSIFYLVIPVAGILFNYFDDGPSSLELGYAVAASFMHIAHMNEWAAEGVMRNE